MNKPVHEAAQHPPTTLQLPMAFTTRQFDQRLRKEIIALLSRLLLQVAGTRTQGKVQDERA